MKLPPELEPRGIPGTFHNMQVRLLEQWIDQNRPTQLELTDRQYHALAALMGRNDKKYLGVHIVFEEDPLHQI